MPKFTGSVNEITVSLQTLVENPLEALANLSPLSSGQVRVRNIFPLYGTQSAPITNGDFSITVPNRDKNLPYRLLIRKNIGSGWLPIMIPTFRSGDLPVDGGRFIIAYRILSSADREWLDAQGARTFFSYDWMNDQLAPAKEALELKVLKANQEDDRVRISFEKEILGPNPKGKVLLEPKPSENYFLERLMSVDVIKVDLFGVLSVFDWMATDIAQDLEGQIDGALAMPALPAALADRSASVTLTAVDEVATGIRLKPAIGVIM